LQALFALLIGLLFGLGVLIAGMSNPAKVLNFFDFAGRWDASLAFVMGGALIVTAIGYQIVFSRTRPLLAARFLLPSTTRIELPFIVGSAVFGIGWGLSGFCPGGLMPALGTGETKPLLFFAGLLAGLIGTRYYRGYRHGQETAAAHPSLWRKP
jgi:uncharacterized membrane protein YedE/YeeE